MTTADAVPAVSEPAKATPVAGVYDICVVGGSCTGVFAAVRAARLGARVALVEKQNAFGGVATSGLVNVWHSLQDTEYTRPIIAGLTSETLQRLTKRNAVSFYAHDADAGSRLNTEELKIELDELVVEAGVTPYLHTQYAGPFFEAGKLRGVFIENKDGRSALLASYVIDATGDGDVAANCGIPFELSSTLQPPTTCAKILGMSALSGTIGPLLNEHGSEFSLRRDHGWNGQIPANDQVRMFAQTHVFDTNAADADQLTAAEIEGRRQVRAMMDIVRKYGDIDSRKLVLLSLASYIGVRETRRFRTAHVLTEPEVLNGVRFDDAIANGSYRVDIHDSGEGNFTFRHLDGREFVCRAGKITEGRWRPESPINPTFYQIPYRCLHTPQVGNLLLAGRMIGTDAGAFGAVRVMVNLNQTGEAAGVAAALALRAGIAVSAVDSMELRRTLADGGSIVI